MQILDLRQVSSRTLEPLFAEEARQWRHELHWDYRPSLELIRKFVDSRALRGAVAIDDERPAGYGFYVLEAVSYTHLDNSPPRPSVRYRTHSAGYTSETAKTRQPSGRHFGPSGRWFASAARRSNLGKRVAG